LILTVRFSRGIVYVRLSVSKNNDLDARAIVTMRLRGVVGAGGTTGSAPTLGQ
jgi:hypothetical protein